MDMQIIMPKGSFGASDDDSPLETLLREFGKLKGDKNEWADKYGTEYEDELVMMHPYCWCEKEDCPWCGQNAPNFLFKPTGLEVRWYKYIGRSMEVNRPLTAKEVAEMRRVLLCS